MTKKIIILFLIFSFLFPALFLLFTVRAHAFFGEETKENFLSILQGILMMFLLHFFSRDSTEEGHLPEGDERLPEGVYFIDTSLLPQRGIFSEIVAAIG